MLRWPFAALAASLAFSALPALAGNWPADVASANRALVTAKSFRVTTTEGAQVSVVDVTGPERGGVVLPPNALAMREADASDGVSLAHLYRIIYPGGSPQVRWYVRVSDGRVHVIRRPGRGGPVMVTIDRYR